MTRCPLAANASRAARACFFDSSGYFAGCQNLLRRALEVQLKILAMMPHRSRHTEILVEWYVTKWRIFDLDAMCAHKFFQRNIKRVVAFGVATVDGAGDDVDDGRVIR